MISGPYIGDPVSAGPIFDFLVVVCVPLVVVGFELSYRTGGIEAESLRYVFPGGGVEDSSCQMDVACMHGYFHKLGVSFRRCP